MANDQLTAKIREALKQLNPADDQHWTDDGLPRSAAVQKIAQDASISRPQIQAAWPGFQRPKPGEQPAAEPSVAADDPLGGETVETMADPAKNTGELMSEDEVRDILEQRVKEAQDEITAAQQNVRDAHKRVEDAQNGLRDAKAELTRQFPPMTAAENIKEYIASEQSQRAAAHGFNGIAPGSQIDMAMQRSNSRGWRRPSRNGQTQTGASKAL